MAHIGWLIPVHLVVTLVHGLTTMPERDWTMDDVEMLYEFPEVYDGWSAARLKDGRLVNRWNAQEYHHRWVLTQAYIDKETA